MNKIYRLTTTGKAELEAELKELIAGRGKIAAEIATARDFGDLSENAEYSAAKDKQNAAESRIAEIENILKNSETLSQKTKSIVSLGSVVGLKDGKKEQIYNIVSPVEANPLERKISNESPLGLVLSGKKVGDTAELKTPKGLISYKITSIS